MTKIDMIQGTNRNIVLTFYQSDGSTPIDLTSGKVYFTVDESRNPGAAETPALQKTVTVHTQPTNGKTTVALLPADTSGLTAGTYHYDAKVITAAGNEVALSQDTFILRPAVTRAIA